MLIKWDTVLPHNSCCDICCQFISFCRSEDLYCDRCNVVVHIACLFAVDNGEGGKSSGHWVCNYCSEDLCYKQSNFREKKAKIRIMVAICYMINCMTYCSDRTSVRRKLSALHGEDTCVASDIVTYATLYCTSKNLFVLTCDVK